MESMKISTKGCVIQCKQVPSLTQLNFANLGSDYISGHKDSYNNAFDDAQSKVWISVRNDIALKLYENRIVKLLAIIQTI